MSNNTELTLHKYAAKGDYVRVREMILDLHDPTRTPSTTRLRRSKSLSSIRERYEKGPPLFKSIPIEDSHGQPNSHHPSPQLLDLLNQPNRHGTTPLQAATYHGRHRVVQLLLAHGARPNQPSQSALYWTTALHLAACQGHLRILATLLEAGADPYFRDYRGWTAAEVARVSGNRRAHRILTDWIHEHEGTANAGSAAQMIEEVNIDAGCKRWRSVGRNCRIRVSRVTDESDTQPASFLISVNEHYSDPEEPASPPPPPLVYRQKAVVKSTSNLDKESSEQPAAIAEEGTIYIPPGPWDIDLMMIATTQEDDHPQDEDYSSSRIDDETVDYLPSILEEGQEEEESLNPS